MKTEPPPHRRKFTNAWDEIDYLYHKLLYWLYERKDAGRARAFAKRSARLLSKVSPGHEAIFPEECWSLICEANGDLPGALKHRENEVRLMKRLHEISRNGPHRQEIFRLYGYEELSDRLDLLAVLYHDSGQLEQAIATLQESERLCREHGLAFDGDDLLRDYLMASKQVAGTTGVAASACGSAPSGKHGQGPRSVSRSSGT